MCHFLLQTRIERKDGRSVLEQRKEHVWHNSTQIEFRGHEDHHHHLSAQTTLTQQNHMHAAAPAQSPHDLIFSSHALCQIIRRHTCSKLSTTKYIPSQRHICISPHISVCAFAYDALTCRLTDSTHHTTARERARQAQRQRDQREEQRQTLNRRMMRKRRGHAMLRLRMMMNT